MTKRDLAKEISEKMGITQVQAKAIVQGVLDEILETLVQEGRIELRISASSRSRNASRDKAVTLARENRWWCRPRWSSRSSRGWQCKHEWVG